MHVGYANEIIRAGRLIHGVISYLIHVWYTHSKVWDVYQNDLRFVEDVEVIWLVNKLWRRNLSVTQLHVKNRNVE